MSNEKEFIIDDRVIIPEDVKKMSKDELDKEIARLEQNLQRKRLLSAK